MLDTETKRRIDTARDILVGKVPDPKSQVEQITIALIYKFMDDMDAESEELGGKRKFFAKDFSRYGWTKLMRSGLGGHETLNLYAEAIARMPENPGIPLLFREIFKNAYLPYRDPETLRAFLKVIDEFTYDHSERLGDSFEYLLSVLGSQGDAGQFRTPRHIIDFMVKIIDPKKTETILDPACGTAGFLISSYKHIITSNTDSKGHSKLTPEEKGKLAKNLKGYDISPDMVRLSLVNLYLHGFADPHIYEYDTLASQDRWNEYADVILANPPFMSPKGGIQPHKRFSVQSKRSEVLFVDYMAEHLSPNGRAAIIVPEGIIFQSQTAYVQLRKMLIENYLVAVASLPAGVFNPYSGVKTSILILDKTLAKRASTIAFFKVENDGFGLGAQRRPIDKNDLAQANKEIAEYLRRLRANEPLQDFQLTLGQVVLKEKIAANGDYNLSGERYKENGRISSSFELVPVGKFIKDKVMTVDPRSTPNAVFELLSIPAYDAGKPEILKGSEVGSQKKLVEPGDVLLSRIIPHIRRSWVVHTNPIGLRQIASTEWIVFANAEIESQYLRHVLVSDIFHAQFMQTITGVGGSLSRANPKAVGEICIPLPPLEVQKEIIAEIDGYQKVIDGARAVVENYKPHIQIDPEWPMVEVSNICILNPRKSELSDLECDTEVSFVPMAHLGEHEMFFEPIETKKLAEVTNSYTYFKEGDVLIAKVTPCFENGKAGIARNLKNGIGFGSSEFYVLRPSKDITAEWLFLSIATTTFRSLAIPRMTGTGGLQRVPRSVVENYMIPIPPLATQRAIVSEIKAEQALINANRGLIERFEKKIQATLARIWGENKTS